MKTDIQIKKNIEGLLHFVSEPELKKQMVEALLYIAKLDPLAEECEGMIQSSFYKTIVVY